MEATGDVGDVWVVVGEVAKEVSYRNAFDFADNCNSILNDTPSRDAVPKLIFQSGLPFVD